MITGTPTGDRSTRGSSQYRIILDSFHTLGRKLNPQSIRSIPGDRIFFVQLADAPLIEMDLLYWSRHFRNMPGEGDLDVPAFMQAVMATGYDGPVSLEIFNDQFRGGSPRAIAEDGIRSLVALMDDVSRREPALPRRIAPMPARARVEGVEFIEFAADEAEAARLGSLLTTMGFVHFADHINKDVSLWRQGDINIVINTEREGFAHSTYLSRGTCVCDIGLRVADATETVKRAEALRVKLFHQQIDQGELELPAIHSVGGGVMHFLDAASGLTDVWNVEFTASGSQPRSSGLVGIDHIAQTMSYDEMLTWSLFYTTLFETAKKPVVDVIDPGGVVRSQVIESPDSSLRITLNGADTNRTLAGQFVSGRLGSAVQHIAFVADDIFVTEARIRAAGFGALPIPQNYYADLEARFDLEKDFLEKLRAGNILYDEDGDGRFFQLYSRPYGDGFFFEIVERRNGYGGYGAANAPYRVAAMKRLVVGEGRASGARGPD
ncbi:MAG: TIM barrel protein [Geminicoccaceae bacterium]